MRPSSMSLGLCESVGTGAGIGGRRVRVTHLYPPDTRKKKRESPRPTINCNLKLHLLGRRKI